MSAPVELARVAYRAYGESTGFVTFRGEPMPDWDDLGDRIQAAWIAAAGAVERSLTAPTNVEGQLLLERTDEGAVVITRADQSIAVSLGLLDSLEPDRVSRSGGHVTFTGVDGSGDPLQVVYREVGFNPTINPAANEGGFLLLERMP